MSSLDQRGNSVVSARITSTGFSAIAISMITVEEQMRGWLAVLRSAKTSHIRCQTYSRLRMAIAYFASNTLVDYDIAADNLYEHMRRQGIRIGTQDLRIAATALSLGLILVTRNTRDFGQVPELKLEDWSLDTT